MTEVVWGKQASGQQEAAAQKTGFKYRPGMVCHQHATTQGGPLATPEQRHFADEALGLLKTK